MEGGRKGERVGGRKGGSVGGGGGKERGRVGVWKGGKEGGSVEGRKGAWKVGGRKGGGRKVREGSTFVMVLYVSIIFGISLPLVSLKLIPQLFLKDCHGAMLTTIFKTRSLCNYRYLQSTSL